MYKMIKQRPCHQIGRSNEDESVIYGVVESCGLLVISMYIDLLATSSSFSPFEDMA